MRKETGGPAFPYSGTHYTEEKNFIVDSHGMTLRDYFAAQAMQGIASNPDFTDWSWEVSAEQAYKYADAMLAARSQ